MNIMDSNKMKFGIFVILCGLLLVGCKSNHPVMVKKDLKPEHRHVKLMYPIRYEWTTNTTSSVQVDDLCD